MLFTVAVLELCFILITVVKQIESYCFSVYREQGGTQNYSPFLYQNLINGQQPQYEQNPLPSFWITNEQCHLSIEQDGADTTKNDFLIFLNSWMKI